MKEPKPATPAPVAALRAAVRDRVEQLQAQVAAVDPAVQPFAAAQARNLLATATKYRERIRRA